MLQDDTRIMKVGDKKRWIHDPNSEYSLTTRTFESHALGNAPPRRTRDSGSMKGVGGSRISYPIPRLAFSRFATLSRAIDADLRRLACEREKRVQ